MFSNPMGSISVLEEKNSACNSSDTVLKYGRITECRQNGQVLIDHRLIADRSISCLVSPKEGDLVLYSTGAKNKAFLLSILDRRWEENSDTSLNIELSVNQSKELSINAKHLKLHGTESVDISSFGSLSISACLGNLKVVAQNMFTSLSGILMQTANHSSLTAQQVNIEAKQILSTRGKNQLIIAEEDIRIDAERINMG